MIDRGSPPGSWADALKKPKQSERMVQRAIRGYLTKIGFVSVHVPNGSVLAGDKAKRGRQMALLKGDGLIVGFPDLIVMGTNARIGFMEVKNEGGKQSDNQKAVQEWMERDGHKYAVVRSIEDAAETISEWGWI